MANKMFISMVSIIGAVGLAASVQAAGIPHTCIGVAEGICTATCKAAYKDKTVQGRSTHCRLIKAGTGSGNAQKIVQLKMNCHCKGLLCGHISV